MLMRTILFYTTGLICGLRTMPWLVVHMLSAHPRRLAYCRAMPARPHHRGHDLIVPVPVPDDVS